MPCQHYFPGHLVDRLVVCGSAQCIHSKQNGVLHRVGSIGACSSYKQAREIKKSEVL